MSRVIHFLFDLFSFTGIRDRLRCPSCGSIGTWKPHGGCVDRVFGGDTAGVRRWLCKWCGTYYDWSLGERLAGLDGTRGCWIREDDTANKTADVLYRGSDHIIGNPWAG